MHRHHARHARPRSVPSLGNTVTASGHSDRGNRQATRTTAVAAVHHQVFADFQYPTPPLVGEVRRRTAVDKVTTLQFDRHGNRIWRQAAELMDTEHARRAIGFVAVPFGTCAEPSNVKAGGQSCPFRFRCTGCDHFRTDVSYLPDLTAYLDDLLRNRERIRAAAELDD